jgi:hypothetical protein
MCKHRYIVDGSPAFKGAERVRLCVQCHHAEACVDGRWIDFDAYLDSLAPIAEPDTAVAQWPRPI